MIFLLDRALAILWWFSLAVAALVVALSVWSFIGTPENVNLTWIEVEVPEELFDRAGGVSEIIISEDLRLQVEEAKLKSSDPNMVGLGMASVAILFGLFLFGFRRLRELVASAAAGTPFSVDNVSRLRQIGATYLGIAIVAWVSQRMSGFLVQSSLPEDLQDTSTSLQLDPVVLVTPLVIFALAEVFRVGTDLQQENDLVV